MAAMVIFKCISARATMTNAKEQLAKVDDEKWTADFEGEVKEATDRMRHVWEGDWKEKCDGKRLIEDLAKSATFRTNQWAFKVRLIKEMALNQSEGWKAVEQQLKELLA